MVTRAFALSDQGDLDPVRREILSGRPVIASGGPMLEGAVRQAVAYAGRRDDLRVVHLHGPIVGACGIDGSSRAMPAELSAFEDGVLDMFWAGLGLSPEAIDASFRRTLVPPELDWLPRLDLADIDRGRTVLLVTGRMGRPEREYVRVLRAAVAARCEAGGTTPPLWFRDWMVRRDAAGHSEHGNLAVTADGTRAAIARAFGQYAPSEPAEAAEWSSARDAFEAGIEVRGGEGLFHAEVDGRVLVAFGRERSAPPYDRFDDPIAGHYARRPAVSAYEIFPDGWVVAREIRRFAAKPDGLRRLVRLLAAGGANLLSTTLSEPESPLNQPIRAMFHRVAAAHGYAPLQEFLSARVDVPLSRAVEVARHGQPLMRRIRLGPDGGVRRREFALAYPGVADLLHLPDFAEGVDAGRRAVPMMGAALGVATPVARRLGDIPLTPHWMSNFPRPWEPSDRQARDLGSVLALFGHDRLPDRGDRASWRGFMDCLDLIRGILTRSGIPGEFPPCTAPLLWGLPGATWADRSLAIREVASNAIVKDSGDLVGPLGEWLDGLGYEHASPELALSILAGHGSLIRLVEASARWHADPVLSTGSGRLPPDAAWPVPFDAVDLGDGWRAVPVDGQASLNEEGSALSHCVGGYGGRCLSGMSLILSMRRPGADGVETRVSTVELVPDPDGDWRIGAGAYAIAQHRGRGNAEPRRGAQARLTILRDMLKDGTVPIRETPQPRLPGTRIRPRGAAAEALLPNWLRVLPKAYAGLDLEGILARVAAHDAARRGGMAPEPQAGPGMVERGRAA